MTCLPLRLLSFCFHIPFSPSVTKPGSISICNWQTMVDAQRHLSIKGLFLSYTWPQERGAFVGKKTSTMIMSFIIWYFYSHTFLQARGKDKRNRFNSIFFNPSWRDVLKRNRMYWHCFFLRDSNTGKLWLDGRIDPDSWSDLEENRKSGTFLPKGWVNSAFGIICWQLPYSS